MSKIFFSDTFVSINVCEFTPPVYFLCSLSDGTTIIEDETLGEISSWKRLAKYLSKTNLYITKLRVQTPHKLIEIWDYKPFSLYMMNRIFIAPYQLEAQHYNGCAKVYACSPDNYIWDVSIIFSTDNWAHVGRHQTYSKQKLIGNEFIKNDLIDLDGLGVICNSYN